MEEITISNAQIISFLLVFFRIGAILFTAPFFSIRNLPFQVRVLLSFTLAIVITSAILPYKGVMSISTPLNNVWEYFIASAREVILGISIGFMAQLIFTGIQFAGQLIGNDIGFGMMNIFDPSTHSTVTITAELNTVIAGLIFIVTYSHHYILMGLAKSFDTIPIAVWYPNTTFIKHLNTVASGIFSTGFRIALPIIGVVFLSKIALAMIARTMPQMNVFIIGFPIQISLGLLVMAVTLPLFVRFTRLLFIGIRDNIWYLLQLWSH